MAEAKRGLTAEERLSAFQRDQERLRRERLQRELAGPRWHRMTRIVPLLFRRAGVFEARLLRAKAREVIEALRQDGVFALDTAMRLTHGFGLLTGGDVQVYLTGPDPLERLAREGLIERASYPDTVLIRPWPGPPRLLACLVEEMPPVRIVAGGYRVVTAERLGRELIGAVGPRADLFAAFEKAEERASVALSGT